MLIQMYSLTPLDTSVRASFELKCLPTDDHPSRDEVINYLKSLGVIYFRDEETNAVTLIEPEDDNPELLVDRVGYKAYVSLVQLDEETLTPLPWAVGGGPQMARKRETLIQRNGDDLQWLQWNAEKSVTRISYDAVYLG